MKHLILTASLLFSLPFTVLAQRNNPWLDSTQINRSDTPLCLANGIIVKVTEINPDFVTSVNVVKDKATLQQLGPLADHGCILIGADQQFDVITPREYRAKKTLPATVQTVVYMLNGVMVPDSVRISKAAIRKAEMLLSTGREGVPADTACLSIWTLTDDERKTPKPAPDKPAGGIRIRGSAAGE